MQVLKDIMYGLVMLAIIGVALIVLLCITAYTPPYVFVGIMVLFVAWLFGSKVSQR